MDTCKGVGSIYKGKLYLFIYYLLLSYHRAEASIQANYNSFYNKLKFYFTQLNHSNSSSPLVFLCLISSSLVSLCLISFPLVFSCLTLSPLVSLCAIISIISITSCNIICNSDRSFCCALIIEF